MEILVFLIPLLVAPIFWVFNSRRALHTLNVITASLLLGMAGLITYRASMVHAITYPWLNHFFYLDALSVMILDTILVVGFIIAIYGIGYLNQELEHQVITLRQLKLYYSLTYSFIGTMILVVSTQNLGLMWIAIEATTLASAFLVGFYNRKESIEAAWKYIIICSVGIAFALLGVVLLYYSSVNSMAETKASLNWPFLLIHAKNLDSSILKIAFIFILVGFGTKVGLAPMHTWLPDAHSQAPSPISALLSGVLLNSAMYGIIRVLILVNHNLGSSVFTGRLLMGIGLLSIATAAVFIVTQKDYKRLLAYSSIEHMGIIAVGLGIYTPLAIFGALFHLINHAFTKSMLFLTSGNVYLRYQTREIAKVHGLLDVMPITGSVFLVGLLAIAGLPPFSIFASELNIVMAGFTANHMWVAAGFAVFVAAIFAGIIKTMFGMFFGPAEKTAPLRKEVNIPGLVVISLALLFIATTGWYLAPFIKNLLQAAAGIIGGSY